MAKRRGVARALPKSTHMHVANMTQADCIKLSSPPVKRIDVKTVHNMRTLVARLAGGVTSTTDCAHALLETMRTLGQLVLEEQALLAQQLQLNMDVPQEVMKQHQERGRQTMKELVQQTECLVEQCHDNAPVPPVAQCSSSEQVHCTGTTENTSLSQTEEPAATVPSTATTTTTLTHIPYGTTWARKRHALRTKPLGDFRNSYPNFGGTLALANYLNEWACRCMRKSWKHFRYSVTLITPDEFRMLQDADQTVHAR